MTQIIEPPPGPAPLAEPVAGVVKSDVARKLGQGLIFGIAFGFLLQKGGVAKYHVLIGQLLLVDYTVAKVMLSAVAVGMVGIHFMHRAGLVQYHLKPTRYGANILGGLVFGAGFALSPYCPGTGAAAIGQGNFDAILMVLGMIAGSYLFAEASAFMERTLMTWGDKGELTIHDVLGLSRGATVAIVAPLIVLLLVILEFSTVR